MTANGRLRRVLSVASALALGASASAQPAPGPDSAPAIADAARTKHAQPAVAAVVFNEGATIDEGALGVRSILAPADAPTVTLDDPMHIGSCTKAITALMVATLVEDGTLWWDMTLAQALPDLAQSMHADYREVTLARLLRHRAGVPPFTDANAPENAKTRGLSGPPREQRAEFARRVLTEAPAEPPGTRFVYSNGGYGIAAAIAE
ncbi:MAG TPA: hypothetical protein DEB06_03830, partial [Phycisphaerales bacterium]|nr:hypothetical protein [Phycisphaerales bacterium]